MAHGGADQWARAYFDWLDSKLPAVRVRHAGTRLDLYAFGVRRPAISLRQHTSSVDRAAFTVVGGFLTAADPRGDFVFVRDSTSLSVALRNFTPRLPSPIFALTHAPVHALVMWLFGLALRRRTSPNAISEAPPPEGRERTSGS